MLCNLDLLTCLLANLFLANQINKAVNIGPRKKDQECDRLYSLGKWSPSALFNIQLLNDFAVYIEKYFARICNINRAAVRPRGLYCKFEQNIFQCIPRNHSIIVLSHRLFREGGRKGGREGREGEVSSGNTGFELL